MAGTCKLQRSRSKLNSTRRDLAHAFAARCTRRGRCATGLLSHIKMSQAPAPSAMSVRDVEKLIEATNTYMRPSISAPTLRGKRPSSAPLSRAARNMVGFTHASAAEHQAIQPVRSSRQQSGPPPASGLNVAEWRAKQHPQRPSSAGPRREQQQPPQQPPQLLPSQQQQQPSRPARPQSAGPSRERSQNQVIDLASGQVIAEGATAARPQRPLSATFVRKAARDARLELQRARPGSAQPRSRPSLTGGHQPIIDRSQSTAEMRTGANLISAGAGAAWVASQAERPTKPEWVSTNYLTTPAWRPPSAVQLSIPNVGRVGLAADNKRRVQERTERRQQLAQTGDVDPQTLSTRPQQRAHRTRPTLIRTWRTTPWGGLLFSVRGMSIGRRRFFRACSPLWSHRFLLDGRRSLVIMLLRRHPRQLLLPQKRARARAVPPRCS